MMSALNHKIDFALVFTVRNANPNGDPLDGNRPRTTYDGIGEVSDVCLKRKIRNRWLDEGYPVFVQSDDRRSDEYRSLRARADACAPLKACLDAMAAQKEPKGKKAVDAPEKSMTRDDYAKIACEQWLDVRAFGQVFPFKGTKDGDGAEKSDAVSIGIRGPVTIQSAFSLEPVTITSTQIVKSVNLETNTADPDKKASDTMGMKHRVDYGVYATYGSVNVQLAQKTGFGEEDAQALKEALRTLFRNDATAARPDGSMEVAALVWWEHNCPCGQYSAAKVHRSVRIDLDASRFPHVGVDETQIPGLRYEIVEGE